MIESILDMIDAELEDFDNDRKKERNLKAMLNFEVPNMSYSEKSFEIKPKFKTKMKTSVYIKAKKNNSSLF